MQALIMSKHKARMIRGHKKVVAELIRKHKKISKGIEWHHALFETRKSKLIKYALTDIEKSKSFHLREIDRLRLDITLEKL